MEKILQAGRPRLSPNGAAALLGELFGVAADDARDLGSERDQAFLVLSAGSPVSVLKGVEPRGGSRPRHGGRRGAARAPDRP